MADTQQNDRIRQSQRQTNSDCNEYHPRPVKKGDYPGDGVQGNTPGHSGNRIFLKNEDSQKRGDFAQQDRHVDDDNDARAMHEIKRKREG